MNAIFRPLLWPTIMTSLALIVLLALGFWQLERREWKDALIARIVERATRPPTALPPAGMWAGLDLDTLEYAPVTFAGAFDHENERHWYTTRDGQPGFHVLTPLELVTGGRVLVDRGFIPVANKDLRERLERNPSGPRQLTGRIRRSVERAGLDASDDLEANIWFVRNVPAMTGSMPAIQGLWAPFFVDLARSTASPADQRLDPQGAWDAQAPLQIDMPNNHLSYALTWFGLAITLIGVYLAYHRAEGRLGPPRG